MRITILEIEEGCAVLQAGAGRVRQTLRRVQVIWVELEGRLQVVGDERGVVQDLFGAELVLGQNVYRQFLSVRLALVQGLKGAFYVLKKPLVLFLKQLGLELQILNELRFIT